MKYTNTDKAPGAVGPYSQAILAGNTLYASGQVGINPKSGKIEATDIVGQAEQACKNVGEILKANGLTFDHVVKTTCFLADIADFSTFNGVYAKYFSSKPARSCVAVKDLPLGALCEIEVLAVTE